MTEAGGLIGNAAATGAGGLSQSGLPDENPKQHLERGLA